MWDEVIQDFRELVLAMEPYRDQLVLCGGWAATCTGVFPL